MKKAFITGSNGFVGKWLTDYLNHKQIKVFGVDLQENCLHHSITYCQADILNNATMSALIAEIKPDYIFNLAGITFLPDVDQSPKAAMDANISGVMILLDAVRMHSPTAQLLLIGSSKEYPQSTNIATIHEDTPADPTNFYGISKYTGEMIGRQYYRQFGIDVRCTRSFNHTGPGQSSRFVCSEWARRIAEIALGRAEPEISVGNINAVIDFSDVRDVVAAYYQIITQGKSGEIYNVCSGKGISLQWILEYLISKSGKQITIKPLQEKLRVNESSVKMIGTYTKLNDHTGWKPSISIEQSLDDVYSWWIQQMTMQ